MQRDSRRVSLQLAACIEEKSVCNEYGKTENHTKINSPSICSMLKHNQSLFSSYNVRMLEVQFACCLVYKATFSNLNLTRGMMAQPPGSDRLGWDHSPNSGASAVQMARELLGSWQNPSLGQQILATAGLTGVATGLLNMPTMTPVSGPMASGQYDQAALLSLMRQHQQEQNAQLGGGSSMLRSHSTSTAGLATSSGAMGGGEGEVGSSRGVSPDVGQGQLRDEPGSVLGGLSSNHPQAPHWRQAYAGGVHTIPTTTGTSPVQAFASPSLSSQPSPAGATAAATISAATPSAAGPGRSKQRARRGQATDPHSIAERLRRERIADRMKSLQELVPNSTRVDKASMLDEIIEYVRFLQLQVKVLSMSRLDGPAAEAVMQLMEELEKDNCQSIGAGGLTDAEMKHTERQVALLLETDMGSAMQYLQSKGLCLMPVVLATPSPEKNTSAQLGVKVEPGGNEVDLEACGGLGGLNEGMQDTMEGMALEGVEGERQM